MLVQPRARAMLLCEDVEHPALLSAVQQLQASVLLVLEPLRHLAVRCVVTDGCGHLPDALFGAIEAPLLKHRLLHLEGNVLQAHQEDGTLETRVPCTFPHSFLEPLLLVRRSQLVHQISCQCCSQCDVPLERRRLLRWLERRFFRGLPGLQLRNGLARGCLQALGGLLELPLAVEAEDAGLEGLAQHLLGVGLVLQLRKFQALSLDLAVPQDVPPIRTPLGDVLESSQRLLGILEFAQTLLGLDLPVPSLVVLHIQRQRIVRGIQGCLEQLQVQSGLGLVLQTGQVVVRQPLVLVLH
mmetsp:Transcript_2569/g.6207  ORF Transcript_2569/g.6207 Transcript_2569/m.6207 type:complete len:297 (+) Transcript_2569:144-1034(+)